MISSSYEPIAPVRPTDKAQQIRCGLLPIFLASSNQAQGSTKMHGVCDGTAPNPRAPKCRHHTACDASPLGGTVSALLRPCFARSASGLVDCCSVHVPCKTLWSDFPRHLPSRTDWWPEAFGKLQKSLSIAVRSWSGTTRTGHPVRRKAAN